MREDMALCGRFLFFGCFWGELGRGLLPDSVIAKVPKVGCPVL